ncbi:uncharacterized protein K460DRAFT_116581 [Cucurbitaria berberidis CBS 394.84]|uniref:gamma-glutamylcyclotransferase n=1 Tax=Cucurbitaria berberidis CBS 394.84 TaxID=1168544 RepID=A0A9P4L900_9PLEO|nr:uncharacterized protein K460DRAFT_116581 [Cucurbitaria berberidis CBS 394.84]KAF1845872.1 hypothetical protein K460DRAFT_116581 [Cucurbitaria berberidis CBS 394.84]
MTEVLPITRHESQRVDYCSKIVSQLQALRRCNHTPKSVFAPLPQPSRERLDASLTDTPLNTETPALSNGFAQEKQKTVLYLAYGSNLCNETFRGVRGIRPLSQVNVLVPSLRLTFDLPGMPYAEPCFANSAWRAPATVDHDYGHSKGERYHKDRWHKGLVGVVYEVTLSDYAHIIATEGGGSAYHDILVDCYVLPNSDTVPSSPDSYPFKAHTLFAPVQDGDDSSQSSDRVIRPDPSYAQPSARYLKLITDGAAECDLPAEYQDYLHDIRAYTISSKRQAAGKVLFLAIWLPFVMFVITLSRKLQDKKGRAPWWLGKLSAMLFAGMWLSYDEVFKKTFGDGERTVGDEALWDAQSTNSKATSEHSNTKSTEEHRLLEGALDGKHEKSGGDTADWNRFRDIV